MCVPLISFDSQKLCCFGMVLVGEERGRAYGRWTCSGDGSEELWFWDPNWRLFIVAITVWWKDFEFLNFVRNIWKHKTEQFFGKVFSADSLNKINFRKN